MTKKKSELEKSKEFKELLKEAVAKEKKKMEKDMEKKIEKEVNRKIAKEVEEKLKAAIKEQEVSDLPGEADKAETLNFAAEVLAWPHYEVDWTKVETVEDLKVILKQMDLTMVGEPQDQEMKKFIVEKKKVNEIRPGIDCK